MKKADYKASAELHNRDGLLVATVQIHVVGTPPQILQWGPRFFVRLVPTMMYHEFSYQFVPLDKAYEDTADTKPREPRKGR